VLRAACGWEWLDHNAALDFDRSIIRERRDPVRLPTDEEIAALITACPNATLRALVRTLLGTGMRLEEAASLERRQIDFARKAITLERTKTGSARTVPMSAQVVGTLKALLVRLGCPYVFWHGEGERYHNLSSRLAAIGKRASVQFRRHDLRHPLRGRILARRRLNLRPAANSRSRQHQDDRDIPRVSDPCRAAGREAPRCERRWNVVGAFPGTAATVCCRLNCRKSLIGGGRGIRTPDTACHRVTV
jgi:integrase